MKENQKQNLITNDGKVLVASILNQDVDYLKKICIGTSNTTVAITDTDLGNQIFEQDFDATAVVPLPEKQSSMTSPSFENKFIIFLGNSNGNIALWFSCVSSSYLFLNLNQ